MWSKQIQGSSSVIWELRILLPAAASNRQSHTLRVTAINSLQQADLDLAKLHVTPMSLAISKGPGIDSIPIEFCKTAWPLVGKDLLEAIENWTVVSELQEGQYHPAPKERRPPRPEELGVIITAMQRLQDHLQIADSPTQGDNGRGGSCIPGLLCACHKWQDQSDPESDPECFECLRLKDVKGFCLGWTPLPLAYPELPLGSAWDLLAGDRLCMTLEHTEN